VFLFKVDEDIVLKILEQKDAAAFYAVVDRNRDYLREWLPWVDGMKKAEDYKPVISMWRKQFADEDGFQAGIYYKGEVVGMIGLHGIDRANRKTSIGYWLDSAHQGKGIMTRACSAVIDYVFDTLNLNRVEIRCGTGNQSSRAIPERLGFTHEGTIRAGEFLYDHYIDSEVYGLLKNERVK
jgi:ribosomal-protein-serine acetyltransferase